MKKYIGLLVVFMITTVFTASAKEGSASLSVQACIAVPTGDFGDAFGTGFGGGVTLLYEFRKSIWLTGHFAYTTYGPKEKLPEGVSARFNIIPLNVGIRFGLSEKKTIPYIGGDIGVFFESGYVKGEVLGQKIDVRSSTSDFGIAPMFGLIIPVGSVSLDLNAKYNVIFSEDVSTTYLAVNLGLNFVL